MKQPLVLVLEHARPSAGTSTEKLLWVATRDRKQHPPHPTPTRHAVCPHACRRAVQEEKLLGGRLVESHPPSLVRPADGPRNDRVGGERPTDVGGNSPVRLL